VKRATVHRTAVEGIDALPEVAAAVDEDVRVAARAQV